MQLIKQRLNGSSLMEVIVGLVLLSLSIALTGTFFAQVFQASNSIAKQKAWYDINLWKNNILITKNLEPEEILKPSYKLIKKTDLIDERKGLWMVTLGALKQNEGDETWSDELINFRFYVEIQQEKETEKK